MLLCDLVFFTHSWNLDCLLLLLLLRKSEDLKRKVNYPQGNQRILKEIKRFQSESKELVRKSEDLIRNSYDSKGNSRNIDNLRGGFGDLQGN